MHSLHLASASLRRLALLHSIGFEPALLKVDVIEQRADGESAEAYCARVAREKAQAGFSLLSEIQRLNAVVLGADTEVVLEDHVFGKPVDEHDALAMLRKLCGITHEVITAVCAVSQGQLRQLLVRSQVRFKAADESELLAYVRTLEPFGKAGAYAIQGLGATLVAHLEGSHSAVMGLPIFETNQLLNQLGVFAPWQAKASD